jgi:hypothetical protein
MPSLFGIDPESFKEPTPWADLASDLMDIAARGPEEPSVVQMPEYMAPEDCYICARPTKMRIVYPNKPQTKNRRQIDTYALPICQSCGERHSLYPKKTR